MRTIYKYPIELKEEQTIEVHSGAFFFNAQMQNGIICLWAEVFTTHRIEKTKIRIFGTGHEIPNELRLNPIATIQMDSLVYHVFEDYTEQHESTRSKVMDICTGKPNH